MTQPIDSSSNRITQESPVVKRDRLPHSILGRIFTPISLEKFRKESAWQGSGIRDVLWVIFLVGWAINYIWYSVRKGFLEKAEQYAEKKDWDNAIKAAYSPSLQARFRLERAQAAIHKKNVSETELRTALEDLAVAEKQLGPSPEISHLMARVYSISYSITHSGELNLKDWLNKSNISSEERRECCLLLVNAFEKFFTQSGIHGNISPENVYLGRVGQGWNFRLRNQAPIKGIHYTDTETSEDRDKWNAAQRAQDQANMVKVLYYVLVGPVQNENELAFSRKTLEEKGYGNEIIDTLEQLMTQSLP